MELEKVTAEIRPRSAWEAIDLGVSLVRAHAGALLKGWMVSVYPLCLVILLLSWNSVGWGLFLIWWLKPVWERVALHPLSRSLFGEHPTWRETMKVLPVELLKNKWLVIMGVSLTLIGVAIGFVGKDENVEGFAVLLWLMIIGLLFYRSGLSRSLVLPVSYLEGLDGARSKARILVLSQRSAGSGVGLTLICLLMELCLLVSQLWFLVMMIPEGVEIPEVFAFDAIFNNEVAVVPQWMWLLLAVCYLNALSIVAWFYTGGGFGLYVNTRTWTEGWDIELKFKGLGQRLGILVMGFGLLGSAPILEANQFAKEVLEGEAFEVQTREVFKDKDADLSDDADSGMSSGAGVFGAIGSLLFWVIVVVLVGGFIWVVLSNGHLFRKGGPSEVLPNQKKVRMVAGLNIEPENLPAHVSQVARKLWDDGRCQEALGLLYRGAISSLVTQQVVEIEESDTEMDCLRRLTLKGDAANARYFKVLTGAWMSLAYARRLPDDETIAAIWSEWPFDERGQS